MLKRAVRAAANAFGCEVISIETADCAYLPTYMGRLLKDLSIDAVIDIGANTGQYGALLRRQVGYRGRLLSFEPVSRNFAELHRASQSDHNWSIYQVAIGSAEGDQQINLTRGGDLCSFLVPEASSPALEVEGKETVRVETFQFIADKLADMQTGLSRSFLKIDAQGLDYDIIKGNADLIAECAALQVEAGTSTLYRGERSFNEIIDLVQSLGFKLSRFFAGHESKNLMPRYFDCFLVRHAS